MTGTLDISVVARNGRYAADDRRWLGADARAPPIAAASRLAQDTP